MKDSHLTFTMMTDRAVGPAFGRSGTAGCDTCLLRRSDQAERPRAGESSRRDGTSIQEQNRTPSEAEQRTRPVRERRADDHRPCRILVVDDSPPYRLALRTVLETMDGVQVVGEVASGEQAVASRHELSPDLVFMDVNLPGMDGIEATRRLKEDAPELVVIGLSVQSDQQTVAAMLEAGAAVHVSKGGGLPQVRDVINRYL